MARRTSIGVWVIHLLLWIGVVVVAFPFVWMILSSFKSLPEFYQFHFWPAQWDLSAYRQVFTETQYGRWYFNSIVVAVVVTASELFFASLVGYTLAKFRFRGNQLIFILILSTMMVPTELLVIPWYVMSAQFGWVDTYWGIMFPGLMEAFGVFLMRQFMFGVPDDLLDAARIDGMSEFRIFLQVALPQVKPALSALGILSFLGNWNAYLWPVIVVSTESMRTLPIGIGMFSTADNGGLQWNVIMAMSTLAVIPIIILYFIFQKRIVEGIALTGVKS
ncbi:carbohydrate ABC transporter permease [Alicyclobacillus macrosporangiidus]|uniref:Multiple sugar transport system permease protein n=1 Tax=Alicyclobacillus macrosporangiidus TaxID=392015 RepID=A0A1I7GSI1_9BACL|nr:carbohydrate ABC transporter permease [Alicyclobacillus macrosporangiidus]SFU51408.1 multiple sugar transport system permease protein [Alicyclobacillus macrosporangiidus]